MKFNFVALPPLHRVQTVGVGLAAALLALALGTASGAASAQQDHAQHAAAAAPAATVMTKGIVRSVDAKAGTITIKHEQIVNIDMAPMTMVFKAAKPGLLDGVKKTTRSAFMPKNPAAC